MRNFFATLRCGWVHIQSCYTASKSAKCLRWTTWRGCQIPRHRGSNPAIRTNEKRLNPPMIRAFAFFVATRFATFCFLGFCAAQKCRPVVSVGTRQERVFPPHKGEGVALRSRYGFRGRSFSSQSPLGHAVRCEVSPSAAALLHCCTWRLVSSRKTPPSDGVHTVDETAARFYAMSWA